MLTTKEDADNIVPDNNGAYLVTASTTRQFTVNVNWSEDKIKIQGDHMDSSEEFHFKERVSRAYATVHVTDSVYSLIRYQYKSKSFLGQQQLIVSISPVQKGSQIEYCCVVYSVDSELKNEEISVLSHGNASKRAPPYICTS